MLSMEVFSNLIYLVYNETPKFRLKGRNGMEICLIRHGETNWNASGRVQGREDIPLNANGIFQAEQCGLYLKHRNWRAIITSPLLRARQSADVIANVINTAAVYEDIDLMERDYGKASGLTVEERFKQFPDGKYEGIEDWDTLKDRVYGAIHRSAVKFLPDDIIIVSHGSAINSILAKLSNHEIGTGKTRLKNACINMLEYMNQSFKIVFYNKSAEELGL